MKENFTKIIVVLMILTSGFVHSKTTFDCYFTSSYEFRKCIFLDNFFDDLSNKSIGLTINNSLKNNKTSIFVNNESNTSDDECLTTSLDTFYSQGSLAPNELTSWNTEIDGSGVAPTNFSLGGIFQIQSGHSMTTTSNWNINVGTSQIEILDGGVLQANNAIILPVGGTFTVRNGGTYVHNNTTNFASSIYKGSVVFEPSSNVEYLITGSATPLVSTYGNLLISTTSSTNISFNGALNLVQGNLIFANSGTRRVTFLSNSGAPDSCNVLGDLIVEGGNISLLNDAFGFTLKVGGDFVQSGGTLSLHRGSQNVIALLQIDGNFTSTGGRFNLVTTTSGSGSGCVVVSGGNLTQSGTALFGSGHKDSSGFYFNTSPTVNVSLNNTSSIVRNSFFYEADDVTIINETYNGTEILFGISGTLGSPLAGYESWPENINNLVLNTSSSVRFNAIDKVVENALTLTNGNLVMLSNRTLTFSGPSVNFTRTNGQIDASANNATLILNHTGTLSLPVGLFAANTTNLTLNSGNVALSENLTLTGNLTINQSTVDLDSFTINRNINGGTLTLGNGSALIISSTNTFPSNYSTHLINESSSVSFIGANQTIENLNSGQSFGSLILGGTGTKNLSGLTAGIRGDFSVQNEVSVTLPTIMRFNGDISQAISGLPYQSIEFSGSGNKSFSSDGSLAPNGVMTFGAGGSNIDFDGPSNNVEFTFLSDADATAQMDNATNYTFSGDAVVQRYYSARRAFRFLTSSVTTSGTIRDNWQEGTNNILTGDANNQNPNPGFGTHITGVGGTTNGFDQSTTNGASLFQWNDNTQAWTAVTNTNVNTLEAGTPYRMLLRGDRTTGLLANGATPTISRLRSRGVPHVGNRTYSTTSGSGAYIFVGNPYLAQVNMQTVLAGASNVNDEFMFVWDPFLASSGAYSTVNVVTNTNTGGSANRLLQPGQAVFVETNGASGSLTISETHKVTTATNEDIFRLSNEVTSNENGQISLLLYEANAYALGASQRDGLTVRFGEFDNTVDKRDAIKFGNPDEEFASFSGETRLSFNSRTLPENQDIIQLNNLKYRHQNYVISATVDLLEGYKVFLHDQMNNTLKQLQNNENTLYSFTVDAADEASVNPNRFRIVLEPVVLSNPVLSEEPLYIGLYPNPSSGSFVVYHAPNADATIKVYTLLGQLVYDSKVNTGEHTEVKLSQDTAEGIYLVQLQSGNKVVTEKLIVKK